MRDRAIERIFDLAMELKREQSKLDVLHRIHEDETEEFKAISEACREKEKRLSETLMSNFPYLSAPKIMLEKCTEDKIVAECAFVHCHSTSHQSEFSFTKSVVKIEIKPCFIRPYFKLRILKTSWGERVINKNATKAEWIKRISSALNSAVEYHKTEGKQ